MAELLIVLFLVGVGVAAVVVTFPWGLALLLICLIWVFGFNSTADGVRAILALVFKGIWYLAIAALTILIVIAVFGK